MFRFILIYLNVPYCKATSAQRQNMTYFITSDSKLKQFCMLFYNIKKGAKLKPIR